MYETFYNLKAEPFRLSPDHAFCYEHSGYSRARAYMAYAFMRAEGFVMITGRPGTGKTTLIGELVEGLARDEVFTANLVCTQLQADDLLQSVAYQFRVGAEGAGKAELLQRLGQLFHRWRREGRRALLIVDEAQDLSLTAMEELRLLTNIQQDGMPLLQIFLVGQPELRELVLAPEMEQVHQRIVAASHLEALQPDEVESYVLHRLNRVGWAGDPAISRAIFPPLHKFSEGVPRRINLICSRLFLHGCVERRHEIDVEDLRVVISELQEENLAAGTSMSADDFSAGESAEWAGTRPGTGDAKRPEVRLRAVGDTPDGAPGQQSAQQATGREAKKKVAAEARNQFSTADARPGDGPPPEGVGRVSTLVPGPADSPAPPGPRGAPSRSGAGGRPEATAGAGGRARGEAAAVPQDTRPRMRPVKLKPVGAVEDGQRQSPSSRTKRGKARRVVTVAVALLFLLALAACTYILAPYLLRGEPRSFRVSPVVPAAPEVAVPAPRDPGTTDAGARPAQGGLREDAREPVAESPEGSPPAPADGLDPQGGATVGTGTAGASSATAQEDNPAEPDAPVGVDPADAMSGSGPAAREGAAAVEGGEDTAPLGMLTLMVSFPFDSVELEPAERAVLGEVVEIMLSEPDTTARIAGYADAHGDAAYNVDLSRQRAEAVEKYLRAAGVSEERLLVRGEGVLNEDSPASELAGSGDLEQFRIVRIVIER